ncbi:pilus assembly protein [Siculibacillus lacustris]|uniref:Pilus assembly protein n=1 Tax=Siculibacillus lacustris TaxID=1549641 RepID=A0A4Q9VVS0_9HYPH|nr:TadE/TadG family type IV pilus assembly protein [Siculibacillus lacustris]TBW39308.1 pilus assembly protein [Siculibacillus lacustris]
MTRDVDPQRLPTPRSGPRRWLLRAFLADRRASTAVEFAIIALPFLGLLGAIFESAIAFLAGQILDTAVADAGRLIRTGQAQQAGYSSSAFATQVCNRLYVLFDCSGLTIDSKVYTSFSSVVTTSPIDASGNFVTTGFTFNMGGSSDIVVVRVFYQFPVTFNYLGLNLANLGNGKRLISGVAAFRNEPFPW